MSYGVLQITKTRAKLAGDDNGRNFDLALALWVGSRSEVRRTFLLLFLVGLTVWACRWYTLNKVPIDHWAVFGSTSAECAAAFRPANVSTTDQRLVSPRTRFYLKGGWSVAVGFDESDHAEQFVISKAALMSKPASLTPDEQQHLLAAFGEGKAWTYQDDNGGVGSVWERNDQQAYASYITNAHWMVLLNQPGMERQFKNLNAKTAVQGGH